MQEVTRVERRWDKEGLDATQANIVEAFLKVYTKEGLHQATVSRVVREAGYSRSTFYHHFTSINDILQCLSHYATPYALAGRLVEQAQTIPLEDLTDAITSFYQQRSDLVELLLRSKIKTEYLENNKACLRPIYRALIIRAYDLDNRTLELITDYVTAAKGTLLLRWALDDRSLTLNQINKIADTVFESAFWSHIALQAPKYGGPRKRITIDESSYGDYPWLIFAKR